MLARSLVLAFSIALTATEANAGPSYLFIDMDNDYAQFVDLNSMTRHPPKVDYWMLIVNFADTATKPAYVSHQLRRYTLNCHAKTVQTTHAILYLGSGAMLGPEALESAEQPIPPGTVVAEVEDLLCYGKAPSYHATVHSVDEARALARKLAPQLSK